jgi:hypothetical protein
MQMRKKLLSMFIAAALLLLASHSLQGYGLQARLYLPIFIFIIFFQIVNKKNFLPLSALSMFFILMFTSGLDMMINSRFSALVYNLNVLLPFLLFCNVDRATFESTIRFTSWILIAILIGAVVAFVGVPSGLISADPYMLHYGREISNLYTSLGVVINIGEYNVARASGIYDEPGGLALIVAGVAVIRRMLGFKESTTLIMLLLAFSTGSLALLFFLFFYLNYIVSINKLVLGTCFALVALYLSKSFTFFGAGIEYLFLSRLKIQRDGGGALIAGDNRSQYFFEDLKRLSDFRPLEILFGNPLADGCCNPLWPIVSRGALGAALYYVVVIYFVYLGLKGKKFLPYLGFALLLFQRPDVQTAGYSVLCVAVLFSYKLSTRTLSNKNNYVTSALRLKS